MINRALLALAILAVLFGTANSQSYQNPVMTIPLPVTSTDASGTIGTGGSTFQSLFTATGCVSGGSGCRRGCQVVNTATHTQYVYVGPIANAVTGASYPLPAASATLAAGRFDCAYLGGLAEQAQISITGTSGDTFMAKVE